MVKMFLMICVIWGEGPRYMGGQTKCTWHVSRVKYLTEQSCWGDINHSKKVVLARLRKEFGDKPDGYDVQASCLKAS